MIVRIQAPPKYAKGDSPRLPRIHTLTIETEDILDAMLQAGWVLLERIEK